MITYKEFEDGITFLSQFEHSDGPVVIIDMLIAPAGRRDEVLATWTADTEQMRKLPGLISAQMRQGVGDSNAFFNIAVWESAQAHLDGVSSEEFSNDNSKYPDGTTCQRLLTRDRRRRSMPRLRHLRILVPRPDTSR